MLRNFGVSKNSKMYKKMKLKNSKAHDYKVILSSFMEGRKKLKKDWNPKEEYILVAM